MWDGQLCSNITVWIGGKTRAGYSSSALSYSSTRGLSILELMVALVLTSGLVLAAAAPIWKSFQADRTLRDSLSFADSVRAIKLLVENPKCGSQTFFTAFGDQPISLTTLPSAPINLSRLNTVSPSGLIKPFVQVSPSGDIREMSLVPVQGLPPSVQGADSDFRLKKFYFILRIVGKNIQQAGISKTLSQDYLLALNANSVSGYVAFCSSAQMADAANNLSSSMTVSEEEFSDHNAHRCASQQNQRRLLIRGESKCTLTKGGYGGYGGGTSYRFLGQTADDSDPWGNLMFQTGCVGDNAEAYSWVKIGCLQVGGP